MNRQQKRLMRALEQKATVDFNEKRAAQAAFVDAKSDRLLKRMKRLVRDGAEGVVVPEVPAEIIPLLARHHVLSKLDPERRRTLRSDFWAKDYLLAR